MLPNEQQFQALSDACKTDRLGLLLGLISGRETNSRIGAMLKGYEEALEAAYLNSIFPLPAYQWLYRQPGFIQAVRKAFPEQTHDWLERKAAAVLRRAEKLIQPDSIFEDDRQAALRKSMKDAAELMQRRHYWIGCVSTGLSRYHYPITPHLGNMRKDLMAAYEKVESAKKAIQQITHFSDYIVGLPLPDDRLINSLEYLSTFLRPDRVDDLTPIKRADSSYMERLFVVQLADSHARFLRREDGMPAVITDLFYIEGFSRALDERTVRRLCTQQKERREKAGLTKRLAVAGVHTRHNSSAG